MKLWLLVFAGGGLGSIARYAVGRAVATFYQGSFPWATATANVIACLLLGIVIGMADQRQLISPMGRLFWAVGFCGGFSTFSTFSSETLTLLGQGSIAGSLLYVAGSVVLCLLATWAGLTIGKMI